MREPSILRYVSVLYRYSQIFITKRLKSFDFCSGQYPFILRVARRPGISQDELSEELVIDKGTTAKAIKAMAARGYIRVEADTADKRVHRLYATRKGEEIRDVISGVIDEWREILGKGFSAEENARVDELVRRMSENAAEYIRQ